MDNIKQTANKPPKSRKKLKHWLRWKLKNLWKIPVLGMEMWVNVVLLLAGLSAFVYFMTALFLSYSNIFGGAAASAQAQNELLISKLNKLSVLNEVVENMDGFRQDMADFRNQLDDFDARLTAAMEPIESEPEPDEASELLSKAEDVNFSASVISYDLALLPSEDQNKNNRLSSRYSISNDVFSTASLEDIKMTTDYILSMNANTEQKKAEEMARSFVKWTRYYDVPLNLAVGVAHVESNFRPDAVGIQTASGKAIGSMQVMYSVHTALLEAEGIKSQDEVMTVDGGIRAGCYILNRYIRAEKSVTSALGRYFSRLDGNYILRKVLASALTFEQYRTGMLPIDGVKTAHEKESKTMGLLISYAPAPTKRPPSSKGVRVVNSSVPKKNSYAKISAASPPKEMTVFKRK